MERQYIGARYVPVFANPTEWNNQVAYQPLTVVTYLGASYTSKKDVPAGIQPTNADYWALTGNYNAQVESYRQEVETYKREVTTYTNIVNSLPPFKLDNFVLIGDSFLQGSGDPRTNWGWEFYQHALSRNPNLIWSSSAEGGAGWNTKGQQGHDFADLVNILAQSSSAEDRAKVQTVICMGGINDTNAKNTIDYTNFILACNANYPNAELILAYTPVVAGINPDYAWALFNPSVTPHVHIITDSVGWLYCNPSYQQGDNLHPSTVGQKIIAACLWSYANCIPVDTFSTNITTYKLGVSDFNIAWIKHGNNLTVYCNSEIPANLPLQNTLSETLPLWLIDAPAQFSIPLWSNNGIATLFSDGAKLYVIFANTSTEAYRLSSRATLDILSV